MEAFAGAEMAAVVREQAVLHPFPSLCLIGKFSMLQVQFFRLLKDRSFAA